MSNTINNPVAADVRPITLYLTERSVQRIWDALDEYGDARYHSDDKAEVDEATEAWTDMGRLQAAAQHAGFADPAPADPLNKQR